MHFGCGDQVQAVTSLAVPDGKLHIEGTLNGAREGVMLTRGQPGTLRVGRQRTDERAEQKSKGKIEEKGTHLLSCFSFNEIRLGHGKFTQVHNL